MKDSAADMSTEVLSREVRELRREVTDLSSSVRDLVDAWRTARGLVRAVKVLGTLATGITGIWLLVRLVVGRHL